MGVLVSGPWQLHAPWGTDRPTGSGRSPEAGSLGWSFTCTVLSLWLAAGVPLLSQVPVQEPDSWFGAGTKTLVFTDVAGRFL